MKKVEMAEQQKIEHGYLFDLFENGHFIHDGVLELHENEMICIQGTYYPHCKDVESGDYDKDEYEHAELWIDSIKNFDYYDDVWEAVINGSWNNWNVNP